MAAILKPGDMCRVEPADKEDPVANEHAGKRCKFVRYVKTEMATHTVVQFSTKGHPVFLRERDVRLDEDKT